MKAITGVRWPWKWAILAIGVLALAAYAGQGAEAGEPRFDGGSRDAAGAPPPPGPDFSAVVFLGGVEIKDDCDTGFGDRKCVVHPGQPFTLRVYLDDLGPLPDTDIDTTAGFTQAFVRLDYSSGLTVKPATAVTSMPCDLADTMANPGRFNWGCFNIGPNESTYIGELFSVDFNCPPVKSKESITIVHGQDFNNLIGLFDSYLLDDGGTRHVEPGASDTVIINCDNDFVWDVTDDGVIDVGDIFQVVLHFGEVKPTP